MKFSGKTVSDALCSAIEYYKVPSECIIYEVIDKGNNSIFSQRDAVVDVFIKGNSDEIIEQKEKEKISKTLNCPDCNGVVSKQAMSCPHCGRPLKQISLPKCPRCGSTNITTGARGWKITTGFIGSGSTVNRCAKCGNTWKPKR